MACYLTVGTDANNAADHLVSFVVNTGDTVTVANNANSTQTINLLTKGASGGNISTVAAGASTNVTIVGTHYITSVPRADVKLTGGVYGK